MFTILCGLIISLVCLLSIGLPTYLLGCNNTMYPQGCVGYYEDTGVVQSHKITENKCEAGTCYHLSIEFDVCNYDLGTFYDMSSMLCSANKYPIGYKYDVYRTRVNTDNCITDSIRVTNDLPITGIVFLVLAGINMLVIVLSLIMCKDRKK